MGLSQLGIDRQGLFVQLNRFIILLQLAIGVAHVAVRHGVRGVLFEDAFKGLNGFLVVPRFDIAIALVVLRLRLLWAGWLGLGRIPPARGIPPPTAPPLATTTGVGVSYQRRHE